MRTAEQRFWNKVNKDGPVIRDELGPCWEWTGKRKCADLRYGLFSLNGKEVRAHRYSYELHFGPPTLHVCHKCDNPPCVNPEHLWLGTDADNSRDMYEKGRHPFLVAPRGEANKIAKLTDATVAEIRRAYVRGVVTQQFLADQFGVTRAAVGYVVRGDTWTHI